MASQMAACLSSDLRQQTARLKGWIIRMEDLPVSYIDGEMYVRYLDPDQPYKDLIDQG